MPQERPPIWRTDPRFRSATKGASLWQDDLRFQGISPNWQEEEKRKRKKEEEERRLERQASIARQLGTIDQSAAMPSLDPLQTQGLEINRYEAPWPQVEDTLTGPRLTQTPALASVPTKQGPREAPRVLEWLAKPFESAGLLAAVGYQKWAAADKRMGYKE